MFMPTIKPQGVFISVVTPFDHRGNIWEVKVEHNVAKWNRTTVAGYVVKAHMVELVTKFAEGRPVFTSKPEGLADDDATFAKSLTEGATGIVSTIANAIPYTMISIWEAHRTRDFEAAADWQARIASAVEIVQGANGEAMLKHAMDLNGYYGGPPRLPDTVLTPDQKRRVEIAFCGLRG
jgi:dihydrodipicolinate synthase/N-acetylneuraminate lyase